MYKIYNASAYNPYNVLRNMSFLFCQYILKVQIMYPFARILSCEDGYLGNRKRRKVNKVYKTGRVKRPQEITLFMKRLYNLILKILNVENVHDVNFEADDVIAQLAYKYSEVYDVVTILGQDKDLLQTINYRDNIEMIKGTLSLQNKINRKNFYEKIEVEYNQLVDYYSLIGDTADKITGCPGVGPITAKSLLKNYGNLRGIYDNIDELSSKLKKLLLENKREIMRSRILFKIPYKNFKVERLKPWNYQRSDTLGFIKLTKTIRINKTSLLILKRQYILTLRKNENSK